jgi:hypothetical protein
MAKCTICNKPIILIPSAAQRAKNSNEPASFYTALFAEHNQCAVKKRSAEATALMRQIASNNAAKKVSYSAMV